MPSAPATGALLAFDQERGRVVAGCDEAGRGCFAGPLIAAGVRFDYAKLNDTALRELAALNDSKKLTPTRREALYPVVLRHAAQVAVVTRAASTIDRDGLHRTNLAANRRALMLVAVPGAVLLADGFALADIDGVTPVKVIRGDSQSACIAAASIIAKVTRDRLMSRLDVIYPGYGFAQHAGYGTKRHQAAIAEHGLCAQHRRSFKNIAALAQAGR